MVRLSKELRGFSIVESLVGLSIISLVFSLTVSLMVKVSFSSSDKRTLFFEVDARVEQLKSKQFSVVDTVYQWKSYIIEQEIKIFRDNETLTHVLVTARREDENKVVYERNIVLTP